MGMPKGAYTELKKHGIPICILKDSCTESLAPSYPKIPSLSETNLDKPRAKPLSRHGLRKLNDDTQKTNKSIATAFVHYHSSSSNVTSENGHMLAQE